MISPALSEGQRITDTMHSPRRVLLVAEGTYPHQFGGVSTWCDLLVRSLPDVRFWVWAITPRPGMPQLFDYPANLEEVHSIPLWNVRDVKESWIDPGVRQLHDSRTAVTDNAIEQGFLPAFRDFLHALLHDDADPQALASTIHTLYRFLLTHDLCAALGSTLVWEAYVEEVRAASVPDAEGGLKGVTLAEVSTGFAWVSRWLFPLAREIPEVDVVHLAMAGVCCMPAAAASLEHGAGVLLTEHGVYLREAYLAASSEDRTPFLKRLGIRYARRMTELGYFLAGQVSPCCDYNQRWEREMGADSSRLETIYYGLDSSDYTVERPLAEQPRTVVWVGRINPLKDVETLLRAAALVVAARHDVRFLLFGSAPAEDADYHARCLALHQSLGLEESVIFRGFTSRPIDAYNEGDLVVMSSVSEGLPFSILEAMLCGRPIVSTAVGGIPEQIDGIGIAVEPRDPDALARAILTIIDDPGLCHRLGAAAREKGIASFGVDRFADAHRNTYDRLSSQPRGRRRLQLVSSAEDRGVRGGRGRGSREAVPRLWHMYLSDSLDDGGRTSFRDLWRVVHSQDSNPVDSLQVAALIEAGGITDSVAQARYMFPDTFSLADALFEKTRRHQRRVEAARVHRRDSLVGEPASYEPARLSHLDTARHPVLAFLPAAALLMALWLLSSAGRLSGAQVLGLSLGMTTGMLCTNGVALGMGRRASSLISLGKVSAARRLISRAVLGGLCLTVLVTATLVSFGPPRIGGVVMVGALFVVAASAVAVVWVLAAALSLVSCVGWTGVSLWTGVAAGVAAFQVTDRTPTALGPAVAIGYAVALLMLVWGLNRALLARAGGIPDTDRTLPARNYLLLEALPGFCYGTLGVIMFASIHVIGWIGVDFARTEVATLEVGLFLTLGPVILGAGHAERGVRLFWIRAAELQIGTPLTRAAEFNSGLWAYFSRQMRRYLAIVSGLSLLTAIGLEILVQRGVIARMVPGVDLDSFRMVAATSLIAYTLLGWGQYCSAYGLALARWRGQIVAIGTGTVVTILAAVLIVGVLSYVVVALGLALGAGLYGFLALSATRRALATADHLYVHAL